MLKKSVLSGMQPSGKLHLGNLVGALENWVRLQDEYQCYYFIADWHALSTNYADTSEIKNNVTEMAIDWLTAGLDPEKCIIFQQSQIPEHAVLFMLIGMITPIPWLERNPTYKEKQEEIKEKDLTTYGFLGYPILQAADILLYKANFVPVGIDQLPHLEITRELARRVNFIYGKDVLIPPEAKLSEFPKLPGLDGRKMSKSYNNAIYLSDSPEIIRNKINTMVSNPQRPRRSDPGDPEQSNVYAFHKVFTPEAEREQIAKDCREAKIGCRECKEILIKNLLNKMQPYYEKRKEIASKPQEIKNILAAGSSRAQKIAQQTLAEVKELMKI